MGARSRLRRWLEALVPVGVPVLVAGVAAMLFAATAPSPGHRFSASSAYDGYVRKGWTGHVRGFGLFVHSKKEKQPWIEIDLGKPRSIRRVKVHNWREQPKRGVPLALEVEGEDGSFREVARRDRRYHRHTFEVEPVVTSKIRLRVVSSKPAYLHLEKVDVD